MVDYHVPLGEGDARHRAGAGTHPRGAGPRAGRRDAVGLRQRLAGPAGGIAERDRAGRAAGGAAADPRPAARLPLASSRRRSRSPSARSRSSPAAGCSPCSARRDDDRRALAGRLHDDGPGARGRLLAADRLPLPRGAGGGPRALGGGRGGPGQRRAHDPLRRRHAGRRPRLLGLPAARLAAALAGDGDRRRHRDQRRRSRPWRVPPLLALLGERINAGRIGRRARRRRRALDRSPRAGRRGAAHARPWPPAWSRCRWCCWRCRRSPSPPAPRASTSCRARTRPARTPKRSTAPSAPAGRRRSSSSPPPNSGPITTQRKPRAARPLAAADRRRARGAGGDRPGPIAAPARAPLQLARRRSSAGRRARESARRNELEQLGPGLRRAARRGGASCAVGIAEGAAGSGLLAEGSERAAAGAGLIATELAARRRPRRRSDGAIGRLEDGQQATRRRPARGLGRQPDPGARPALAAAAAARRRAGAVAQARPRSSKRAAAADPSLRPAANQARLLARTIAANRDEVRRLRDVAQEVNGGLNRLVPGGKRLEDGVGELADAAGGLSGGLDRLGGGAERLAGGLTELQGGAGALQAASPKASSRSYPLQRGSARRRPGHAPWRRRWRRRPPAAATTRRISSTPATSSSRRSTARRRSAAP